MDQLPFTPEVQSYLDDYLSRRHHHGSVATFDLDGTCEHRDTGEAVLYTMARTGQFHWEAILDSPEIWRPFDEYQAVLNPRQAIVDAMTDPSCQPRCAKAIIAAYWELLTHAGKSAAYSWAAYLFAGKTVDEVRSISRATITAETERTLGVTAIEGYRGDPHPLSIPVGLRPYEPMRNLVRRLHAARIECWIVSATNRWTVEVYADMFLGIPAGRILGITPRIRGGHIQGESDPAVPITVGAGKAAAIDRFIGRRPIFAAGDSIGDWEMLEAASDLCLVIDHGDAEMRRRIAARKQAEERTWIIQPRFIDPPALPLRVSEEPDL